MFLLFQTAEEPLNYGDEKIGPTSSNRLACKIKRNKIIREHSYLLHNQKAKQMNFYNTFFLEKKKKEDIPFASKTAVHTHQTPHTVIYYNYIFKCESLNYSCIFS